MLLLSGATSGPRDTIVTGHYTTRFETSSFVPCDEDEQWWVEGPALEAVDSFLRTSRSLPTRAETDPLLDGTVFLRWRGSLSALGQYGHMGSYDRQFKAEELLEIHQPDESDCEDSDDDRR
jgi:hypothetical protein